MTLKGPASKETSSDHQDELVEQSLNDLVPDQSVSSDRGSCPSRDSNSAILNNSTRDRPVSALELLLTTPDENIKPPTLLDLAPCRSVGSRHNYVGLPIKCVGSTCTNVRSPDNHDVSPVRSIGYVGSPGTSLSHLPEFPGRHPGSPGNILNIPIRKESLFAMIPHHYEHIENDFGKSESTSTLPYSSEHQDHTGSYTVSARIVLQPISNLTAPNLTGGNSASKHYDALSSLPCDDALGFLADVAIADEQRMQTLQTY